MALELLVLYSSDGEDLKNDVIAIEDSGDIPQMVTSIANGLNGTIGYIFETYTREITAECRSQASRDGFMAELVSNEGTLTIDSVDYLVQSISFTERFNATEPVYTFRLTLFRSGSG